jgi:tetratricopeptide (TPR) repeat protein
MIKSMIQHACLMTCVYAIPHAPASQQLSGRDRWADSARVLIESAVRHGSDAGIDSARILIERALTVFPDDPMLQHYDGYALYRKATMSLGRNPGANTTPILEQARDILDKSAKKLALPETFSLQAALYGQIISHTKNPISIMSLGIKSGEATSRAVEEGARNPRVWLLRGIGAMFTPSMWGGGMDKAEEYLKKSLTLYQSDKPSRPLPAWGNAEAYIWLGQVYAKQGKTDSSRAAYANAIKLEPDNGWARALLDAKVSPVPTQ